jgi:hypothetical protein
MKKTVYKMELDWLQEMSETYFERELSETEVKRLDYIFYDEGTFFQQVDSAFQDAVEMAMDSKEEWKGLDESVKDTPLSKMFGWEEA